MYIAYRANTGCDLSVPDGGAAAAADQANLLQYDWMNFLKTKGGIGESCRWCTRPETELTEPRFITHRQRALRIINDLHSTLFFPVK